MNRFTVRTPQPRGISKGALEDGAWERLLRQFKCLEFGEGHLADHVGEVVLAAPAEDFLSFGGIADEAVGFHGPDQARVALDEFLPVEADGGESDLNHFLNGVGISGGEDKVFGRCVLKDHPHAADIILRVAPITFGAGVAERKLLLPAKLDGSSGAADFAGDEVFAAAGRLVVVKDAVAREEAEAFAVNGDDLGSEGLCATVGIHGRDGRGEGLRRFGGRAKDFAGGSMKEAAGPGEVANEFEQTERAHGGHFAGRFRDFEAQADVALAGEMINFFRGNAEKDATERGLVGEFTVVEEEAFAVNVGILVERVETGALEGAGAANDSVNFVTFFEEKFSEVGTVLASNSGDERFGHLLAKRKPRMNTNEHEWEAAERDSWTIFVIFFEERRCTIFSIRVHSCIRGCRVHSWCRVSALGIC